MKSVCHVFLICCLLAGMAASQERRVVAIKLLNQAFDETAKLPDYSRSQFYVAIGREQVELEDFEGAFRTIKTSPIWAYEALCAMGGKLSQRSLPEGRKLIARLEEGEHTVLYCMAESLLGKGEVGVAERIISEIMSPEVKASATSMVQAYKAKHGALAQAVATNQSPEMALHLATEAGDFDGALKLAGGDHLKRFGVFAAQGVSLSQAKKPVDAKRAFKSAGEEVLQIDRGDGGVTYFLIAYLAKADLFEDAEALALKLTDQYSRPKAWATIAIYQARRGDFTNALNSAEKIRASIPKGKDDDDPSESYYLQALQMISRCQVNASQEKDALQTLARAEKVGPVDGLFMQSIRFERAYALSSSGEDVKAKSGLKRVEIGSFDDEDLSALALVHSGYCRKHSVAECTEWMEKGYTSLQRIAALIGAAKGLVRDEKLEVPEPIFIH
jgi:tetratricopeptide (TPR) repeat protein